MTSFVSNIGILDYVYLTDHDKVCIVIYSTYFCSNMISHCRLVTMCIILNTYIYMYLLFKSAIQPPLWPFLRIALQHHVRTEERAALTDLNWPACVLMVIQGVDVKQVRHSYTNEWIFY